MRYFCDFFHKSVGKAKRLYHLSCLVTLWGEKLLSYDTTEKNEAQKSTITVCGGLNVNILHRLLSLNTLLSVGCNIWVGLGSDLAVGITSLGAGFEVLQHPAIPRTLALLKAFVPK